MRQKEGRLARSGQDSEPPWTCRRLRTRAVLPGDESDKLAIAGLTEGRCKATKPWIARSAERWVF
jgi:hypothetical protein